jgi:nickel/cobalt transporter (NicO) family protein
VRLCSENGEFVKSRARVWTTCTIGGAVVIFLFGLLLFTASLGPARPF